VSTAQSGEYAKSCTSDYDCGDASRCVKRQYTVTGVCGPRGGATDFGLTSGMPYSFSEPECSIDMECKRGFQCLDRQCVKDGLRQLPE